jgi:hypothetical protein
MTATAERYDVQTSLNRPLTTLADAGKRITDERKALLHLLEVAELDVVLGIASEDLVAAVDAVRVVRHG